MGETTFTPVVLRVDLHFFISSQLQPQLQTKRKCREPKWLRKNSWGGLPRENPVEILHKEMWENPVVSDLEPYLFDKSGNIRHPPTCPGDITPHTRLTPCSVQKKHGAGSNEGNTYLYLIYHDETIINRSGSSFRIFWYIFYRKNKKIKKVTDKIDPFFDVFYPFFCIFLVVSDELVMYTYWKCC